MLRLSIVIVSYNTRADLNGCLRSLTTQPPLLSHDITVVDNASRDDSVEAARAFATVRVIPLDRNVGFAAANNVGIRATESELLLLLNPDTIVPPGAVDALVARLDATPAAAVAGPRVVDAEGRPELSFGRMISPLHEFRQKRIGARYDRGVPDAVRWVQAETAREQFVDWVSGACLLVWRAEAAAVGLLDERFFIYTEDVDFCASVRARGRKVLFTPAAQITHLRGRSRASAPRATNDAYRRSHVAFYEKHHPAWAPWLKLYLRLNGER
jgi:N-acetylglucosaminyl-diphospho-decaprenol L-rhamnosyltransferase